LVGVIDFCTILEGIFNSVNDVFCCVNNTFGRIQTTDNNNNNNNNNTFEWIVRPLRRWFLIRSNQIFVLLWFFPVFCTKAIWQIKSTFSVFTIYFCNDHPRDPKIVAVVDRWSLFRGHLCYKMSNWNLNKVAVVDRWSLFGSCR